MEYHSYTIEQFLKQYEYACELYLKKKKYFKLVHFPSLALLLLMCSEQSCTWVQEIDKQKYCN